MGFLFLIFAAGLAAAAVKTEGTTRLFFAACAALNLAAIAKGYFSGDPDAWRLRPNYGPNHENWRR